jgi:hypothetical protein
LADGTNVYWLSNSDAPPRLQGILACSLSDTTCETSEPRLVLAGFFGALAIDGHHVYAAELGDAGDIRRIALCKGTCPDDAGVEILAPTQNNHEPHHVHIVVDETFVYWSLEDGDGGVIMRRAK